MPEIQPSRHKCSGKVAVSYEGQLLPVSKAALQSPATQNTICRQLDCGQVVKVIDYAGLQPAVPVITDIQCPPNTSGLFDCSSSIADQGTASSTLGGLQCSSMF